MKTQTIPKLLYPLFAACFALSLSACDTGQSDAPEALSSDKNIKAGSENHAEKQGGHDHSQHHHGDLDIKSFGDDTPVPEISFTIEADAMSGWNIHISTQNFRFAPEAINADATPGEGHAHIYVDGHKFGRVYSDWYHLKKLTQGPHEVRISLNANDHSNWSHNGAPIEAKQTVTQH